MAVGWIRSQKQGNDREIVLSYDLDLTQLDQFNVLVARVDGLEESVEDLDRRVTILEEGGTGGGVTSFNARTGDVLPEEADYASFYDPLGAAAAVQANLDTHIADTNDPHQTKADLQTFVASNSVAGQDENNGVYVVLSSDVDKFLGLEVFASYEQNDIVTFRVELPIVSGSTGNSEFLLELVYDKGGPNEIVIASQQERIGNNTISINTTIQAIYDQATSLPIEQVGLYGTGISGTITIDGSLGRTNFLLATRTRNFSYRAYPVAP